MHELFVPVGGSWSHADLTQLGDAPRPDLDHNFAGFEWGAGRTKQVAYVANDFDIHEVFVEVGGSWSDVDLTKLTGDRAQVITAAYGWDAGGTKQVVLITEDGIHELFVPVGGSWSHVDLTQITGGPPPASNFVAGYGWNAGRAKQVAYATADGHIHELFVQVGGSWSHVDLTDITGAPPLAQPVFESPLVGYAWEAGRAKQVVYCTEDRHIHELFVIEGGSWNHVDLTQITGAPPVVPVGPIVH